MKWLIPNLAVLALALACLSPMSALADPGDLLETIPNPGPEDYTAFGDRVAVAGNDIVVSAHLEDATGALNSGAVYRYRLNGSTWGLWASSCR